MVKKIVIRVVLLLLIVTGLNFVYMVTFYEKDLKEHAKEYVKIGEVQRETDIFYFGESSNITYKETDSIFTSIADLSNFFFPSLKVTMINKDASHAGIYKHWLSAFDLSENKPKALIVTMNLRSFDAAWINSALETPLQQSIVFTHSRPPLVNRFALSLQAFDNKTEKQREQKMLKEWERTQLVFPFDFKYRTVRQWDDAMAHGGFRKPDCSPDSGKTKLACHYIKSYAFNIVEDNQRVKDFDEIAAWCNRNQVTLYLNLLAENVAYADSLVGKELVFLMRQNRDWLVERYSGTNCTVVDNLELVEGKDFIDQDWTTEHYNLRGRMRIARNLALNMKIKFKNDYINAY